MTIRNVNTGKVLTLWLLAASGITLQYGFSGCAEDDSTPTPEITETPTSTPAGSSLAHFPAGDKEEYSKSESVIAHERLDDFVNEETQFDERSEAPTAVSANNDLVSVLDPTRELGIAFMLTTDNAMLITWTRNSNTNQQFSFTSTGDGYYQLKAGNSGRCLQPAAGKVGRAVPVVQATCSSTTTAQRWKLVADGTANRIQNKLTSGSTSYCMEILHGLKADGAPIGLDNCTGGDVLQQFYVTAAQ